jgi:hypothetical protein
MGLCLISNSNRPVLQNWKLPSNHTDERIYASHSKNVECFCCLISRYDSCIIFMDKPPKHCILIKAKVLILYLCFEFWDETKDLFDLSNGPPYKMERVRLSNLWANGRTWIVQTS